MLEIGAQARGAGRFQQQVEFVVDGLFIIAHDFDDAQAPAGGEIAVEQGGDAPQQMGVLRDGLGDARADHFDHDFFAAVQHRRMHLRDRGRGQRLGFKFGEDLAGRQAQQVARQFRYGRLRERRHPVPAAIAVHRPVPGSANPGALKATVQI